MMKKYDNVIFDFDGTIADTSEGIMESLRHSFEVILGSSSQFSDETLSKFIGPALIDSYQKITGMTKSQAEQAVTVYRDYYTNKGAIYKSKVYDGNIEIFKMLKERGIKISVASSKPTAQLLSVIEYLGLTEYFDKIDGALDDENSNKADGIRRATVGKNPVMVGDSIYDILGAKNAGIDCVAVGYGFGDETEMKGYAPAYFANSVENLKEILLQITE